jgi:hypothetical protein
VSKTNRRDRRDRREPDEVRSIETLCALTHCKGGPMRDRRERRAKERKNEWRREDYNEDE